MAPRSSLVLLVCTGAAWGAADVGMSRVCAQRWSERATPPPLVGIITGLEHSGTTVLSWLLKNVNGIFSGFECGFLLGSSPAEFEGSKFAQMMARQDEKLLMWNVSSAGMQELYRAPCFVDMCAGATPHPRARGFWVVDAAGGGQAGAADSASKWKW